MHSATPKLRIGSEENSLGTDPPADDSKSTPILIYDRATLTYFYTAREPQGGSTASSCDISLKALAPRVT